MQRQRIKRSKRNRKKQLNSEPILMNKRSSQLKQKTQEVRGELHLATTEATEIIKETVAHKRKVFRRTENKRNG